MKCIRRGLFHTSQNSYRAFVWRHLRGIEHQIVYAVGVNQVVVVASMAGWPVGAGGLPLLGDRQRWLHADQEAC